MIAAVAGEIEKTQQGDAQGAEFRGYAAGSRHLVGHGGAADMCILGEPTEQKLVLAHFGTLWLRLSTSGPFIHTAFSSGRLEENSIVRMRGVLDRVLEWLPEWEEEMSYGDVRGVANVGAIQGGFGWRVSRTPHRTDLFLDLRVPPDVEMAEARRQALEFARRLDGVEAEVYVTAPGAELDESHPLVGALEGAHEEVFGAPPERDVTRWFSDASVLSRYGIATVNYGTSSGLPDPEYGENLEIDGLVKIAEVYARAAQRICGAHERRSGRSNGISRQAATTAARSSTVSSTSSRRAASTRRRSRRRRSPSRGRVAASRARARTATGCSATSTSRTASTTRAFGASRRTRRICSFITSVWTRRSSWTISSPAGSRTRTTRSAAEKVASG